MGTSPPDSPQDEELPDDFAVESDYDATRADDERGPPDDWERDSWRDFRRGEWWYRFRSDRPHRLDPPPVLTLGHKGGEYWFVTAARELRAFTAGQLHGRGGLADLFAGDVRWAVRHYQSYDREGEPTGRPNAAPLMEALIAACVRAGYYDGSIPFRSVGTWAGPDRQPVVHVGGRIFHSGRIYKPGEQIGDARYVLGPDRAAPALQLDDRGSYEWLPAPVAARATVMAHLDEWHWESPEARELYAGGLWCDMLGDANRWKVHRFLRARASSGKTRLLEYQRALLGGAAHPIQRTYSKARLEEQFAHTAAALLLEEAESDPGHEAQRMLQIYKLILLLSDEGATGGRFKRDIDLHGPVTMAATLTDDWGATIRSRVVLLELRSLRLRANHTLMSSEGLDAMIAAARELSAGLRAAAINGFDLFNDNLELARAQVIALGGTPRDGDTLGHLIAGWATMMLGRRMTEDEVGALERFKPWIVTLQDVEDGADDATHLLNTLLGLPAKNWRGGDQLTIGQLVARAREPDNDDFRRALLPYGMRLEKLPTEGWPDAWLAIANNHSGLDKLLEDYPHYQGKKRTQILSELTLNGELVAKPTDRPLRFAGPQSRGLLIDSRLLPTVKDDQQPNDRASPEIER